MTSRLLCVGTGFVGGAIGRQLAAFGWTVDGVSRGAGHRIDVADTAQRARLAELAASGYDAVLLCHGPSDVTWCDENPELAREMHGGTAVALAGLGVPVLLISTDNVFPGDRPAYAVTDQASPANGYGRAKLAAEQAVLAGGGLVVRVSLVYGWSAGNQRPNFAERCLEDLRAGRALVVPYDQDTTAIYVDDVAQGVASWLAAPDPGVPLLHLAGPDSISRAEFARLAARAIGASENLITVVPRASTSLACRPRYSGLVPGPFSARGVLSDFSPRGVAEGLATMVASATWQRARS
jgi:dTDP-4-dehydrorhamnose reductase